MLEFLKNDKVKVALGLCVGLAIIVILNPPHTVCDSKKETYLENIKKQFKPYAKAMDLCKQHTEIGGCLPLFGIIQKLTSYLEEVGPQCRTELAGEKLTQQWLQGSMEMMVRGAWGSKAPPTSAAKMGWLQLSQVADFCHMKKQLIEIEGDEAWNHFVERLLADLPEAQALGRNEVWARSILSDSCKY